MVSDQVPFRLQVRLSGPNNTNPSWQVNVTSSPWRYNITALSTLPFLGLPGYPQELSPMSRVYSSLVSCISTPEIEIKVLVRALNNAVYGKTFRLFKIEKNIEMKFHDSAKL